MKNTHYALRTIIIALSAFIIPVTSYAIQYRSTWNQVGSSNTNSWGTASNWNSEKNDPTWTPTTSLVPNNSTSSNPQVAVIDNSTAFNLTITDISGTTGRHSITNTGSGSLTLQLGGDLTVQSAQLATGVTGQIVNSGASADKLIWDLNGHNYTLTGANNTITGARNYTIRNTDYLNHLSTWTVPYVGTRGAGTLYVKDNVTFKISDASQNSDLRSTTANTAGMIFDRTATLWLSGVTSTVRNLYAESPNVYGNIVVGTDQAASPTIYNAYNTNGHLDMNIRGDLTYYADSYLENSSPSYITRLKIEGNFTDLATVDAADYGNKIEVYFVSGGSDTNVVHITRSNLTSKIFVGDGTTVGRAQLAADLSTTGDVRVYGNSTLDAAQNTLTGGAVTINDAATIKYTFSQSDGGLLSTSGALTLNDFNLVIESAEAWWGGETKLKLFNFGTLNGTPDLTSIILPSGWDAEWENAYLDVQGNSIYLIPEPTSLLLFLGAIVPFLALCVARRRRS